MIDTEDYDGLLDDHGKDGGSDLEGKPAYRLLPWPWLVLLGLLTIGIGVVGALTVG